MLKLIASAVIAALLLIGAGPSVPQSEEIGITKTPAVQAQALTAEEAEGIALDHAGLTDVTGLRSKFDRDDRIPHWDVEFRAGDWEYDYEIDAAGAVLGWDKEYDPVKTPAAQPVPTTPETPEKLTAQEAKALALAHAGLTETQVRGLRAEFDYDDGVPEYEVEFYADGWEYDYEIHAQSGKILSWDKDRDD